MADLTGFNELETRIRMTLDRLSNQEAVDVSEEWIEKAGEDFKAALRKQFTPREDREFRLRMSNIGRPMCQLQFEQQKTEKGRQDYNHVIKMLLGDVVEVATEVVLKVAGVNITAQKSQVTLDVNGTPVNGEDDIEIDGAVWDVKSSSGWAFNNKWVYGWDGLMQDDAFGYVKQLYGYAKAKNRPMGGWIVVNKETGEFKVVPATPTEADIANIERGLMLTESRLNPPNQPIQRCFTDEEETFYKKPTGNRVLPFTCQYCDYLIPCWPDATRRPQAMSKAQNRKMVWYSEYKEQPDE